MAPPPVTPSPHRFLTNKSSKPQRAKEPTPLSNFSNAPHFNTTPRFSYAASQRKAVREPTLPPSTSSSIRFATPGRQAHRARETIEDSSSQPEQPFHEADEDDEHCTSVIEEETLGENEGHPPKRRRRSSGSEPDDQEQQLPKVKSEEDQFDDLLSSSAPILSSPDPSHHHHHGRSTTTPRFLPSAKPEVGETTNNEAVFLRPPRFRSRVEDRAVIEPLPDQFSPHRKGQKYVPGGLAAEVRSWLVSLEMGAGAGGGSSVRSEDEFAVRLIVDEVGGGGGGVGGGGGRNGSGMTLVRGRQVYRGPEGGRGDVMVDHLGVVNVILAGEGVGEGLSKGGLVSRGGMVGIKGPLWEVTLDGSKWGVGVNWSLLR